MRTKLSLLLILFLILIYLFSSAVFAQIPFLSHKGFVAVLSDLHYPYRSNITDRLIREVVELKPAHVFLTGDLTEMGSEPEFLKLWKALSVLDKSGIKYSYTLGNHDVRWSDAFRKSKRLSGTPYESFEQNVDKFLFIGIDTSFPFQQVGHIGIEQLKWIESTLKKAEKEKKIPIILCHHPFGGPSNYTDDGWKLMNLFLEYKIPLVLYGHGHSYSYAGNYNGTWFQMIGAAKDGYMTVVSWDETALHIWKYLLELDKFELLKSVSLIPETIEKNLLLSIEEKKGKISISVNPSKFEKIKAISNGKILLERTLKDTSKTSFEIGSVTTDLGINFLSLYGYSKGYTIQRFYTLESAVNTNAKLKLIWSYKLQEAIYSEPIEVDGGVIVADYSGTVLFLKDGKEIWRVKVGPILTNIVKENDLGISKSIFVGDIDGNLYFIETKTGKVLKRITLTEPIYAISGGNSTLLVGAGRYGYVIRKSDLQIIAKHDLKGLVQSEAHFENGVYYQTSWGGDIFVINEEGEIIDRLNTGSGYYTAGACKPALIDEWLFYTTTGSKLLGVNLKDKTKKWEIGNITVGYSSVEKFNDFIFVSSLGGTVYKFDKNGKLVWKANTGSPISFSSPRVLSDNHLIIGTNSGEIALIDITTGNFSKYFAGPSYVTHVVPFANQKMLAVTFADGSVKVIRIGLT
ncbi:MAG: metallophosphoesterase [Fervidobacterium sp.]|uniref:metallophosphoesterase n=1 Tax=Fervidobacterium sp. TaxID=1871331 RepID=UPI00404A27D7